MIKYVVVAVVQNARIVVVKIRMASSNSNCRSEAVKDCINPVSTVGSNEGICLPYIILRTGRKGFAGRKVCIVDTIRINGIVIEIIDAIEDLESNGIIEPSSIAAMVLIAGAAFSDVLHGKRRESISQSHVKVVRAVCSTICICVQTLPLLANRRVKPLTPVHIVSSLHLLELGQVNRFHFDEVSWSFGKRDSNILAHEVFFRYFLGKIWNKLRIGLHFEGCLRISVMCLNLSIILLGGYCPVDLSTWIKISCRDINGFY